MNSALPAELRYQVEREQLGAYAERFAPLSSDTETAAWLATWSGRPLGTVRTWWVEQLARFVSLYDAHGFTKSYPMHLLSSVQWGDLLGGQKRASLLDVGAGAGYVTAQATPWFQRIVCTETSQALAGNLAQLGFEVHPHDLLERPLPSQPAFDVISCLNVFDRTRKPRSLLLALRALLSPETPLLVALPLPLRPHVHVSGATVSPDEPLPMAEQEFEPAVVEMSEFFESQGFRIERIARLPYLSRGDSHAPLYELDDALWVLRRAD